MYCQLFIINYATASLMRDFWLHLYIIQINLAAVFGLHKNCSLSINHCSLFPNSEIRNPKSPQLHNGDAFAAQLQTLGAERPHVAAVAQVFAYAVFRMP